MVELDKAGNVELQEAEVVQVDDVQVHSAQGSKLKNVWSQFATSYETLLATLKILVAKLIEAI